MFTKTKLKLAHLKTATIAAHHFVSLIAHGVNLDKALKLKTLYHNSS